MEGIFEYKSFKINRKVYDIIARRLEFKNILRRFVMSYSVATVANAFIDIVANNGFYLTNLKLQKLVYFAHGWYLAFTDTPLIDDEVQSWKYGPVIQSLHYELKHYGSGHITKKIPTDKNIVYESEDWNFLCSVYHKYSIFSLKY
jgi:uncharacterized phage-associated protein